MQLGIAKPLETMASRAASQRRGSTCRSPRDVAPRQRRSHFLSPNICVYDGKLLNNLGPAHSPRPVLLPCSPAAYIPPVARFPLPWQDCPLPRLDATKMNRLTLHVGLHKTGTSAIQRAAAHQRDGLRQIGLHYPPSDPHVAHHSIASLFVKAFKHGDAGAMEKLTRQCETWIQNCDGEHFLVSSEIFMEERAYLRELGFFRRFFSQVDAIIYLRRQDLMLESAYNQMVKQSGCTAEIMESRAYFTNYTTATDPLEAGVGDGNVQVRLYEPGALRDDDVFRDLLTTIGYTEQASTFNTPKSVNRSLGLASLEVMKALGNFKIKNRSTFVSKVLDMSPGIFGERERSMVGHYLRPNERTAILDSCASSNEKIRARYFPEREWLFSPPVPSPDDGPITVTLDEVNRVLIEAWNACQPA